MALIDDGVCCYSPGIDPTAYAGGWQTWANVESCWTLARSQLLMTPSRIVSGRARKHPDPVLLGDRPWESFGPLLFGTVMVDQERFRMWYNPYPVVPPPGNSYYVGYAESFDGLQWEKPDLDIEPYGDFQRTNLVQPDPAQPVCRPGCG